MSRRLGTSASKTALLVQLDLIALDLTPSAVVSTYAKWIKSGEISRRSHGVGHPLVVKEKRTSEIVQFRKENRHQTVAQLTATTSQLPTCEFFSPHLKLKDIFVLFHH